MNSTPPPMADTKLRLDGCDGIPTVQTRSSSVPTAAPGLALPVAVSSLVFVLLTLADHREDDGRSLFAADFFRNLFDLHWEILGGIAIAGAVSSALRRPDVILQIHLHCAMLAIGMAQFAFVGLREVISLGWVLFLAGVEGLVALTVARRRLGYPWLGPVRRLGSPR